MKIPKKKKPAVSPNPPTVSENSPIVSPEPPSVPPPPVNPSNGDPSAPPAVRLDRMVEIPVDRLRKAPWNYKDDDEFKASQLAANLQRNGQLLNLIVRHIPGDLFEVIDGNHRLDAVLLNKWASVICYDLGEISERQAKRIAIEINETRFPSNISRLAPIITELNAEFGKDDLLKTFPYPASEIDSFLSLGAFDWESPNPKYKWDDPGSNLLKLEILLTAEQMEIVNSALTRIITEMNLEGKTKMGRALELVCADSLNTPIESFR